MDASTHPWPRPRLGEHLMDETLATRNASVVTTMNEPTACRSACLPPRRSVATSGHAWTNLSLRHRSRRHPSGFGTKQSRAGLTAMLTATRPDGASRSGTCGAHFPRETDLGVRLETLRADLRIRRLGVRIPPGQRFPCQGLLFPQPASASGAGRLWELLREPIERQQRLGHSSSSCAFLALDLEELLPPRGSTTTSPCLLPPVLMPGT